MAFLMFVCAFALCAKAGGEITVDGFNTGTSFEKQELGEFHPENDDEGVATGFTYWRSEAVTNSSVVAEYTAESPAYDYPASSPRNPYLATEGEDNTKYLTLDLDASLERLIMSYDGGAVSNVFVKTRTTSGGVTTGYDGIYADTLVKLSPSLEAPTVDWDADRVIVWLHESETDAGATETNLMITAGRYLDGYGNVTTAIYKVASPVVAADKWCRLTIRAVSDITQYATQSGSGLAQRAPAFVIYIDGQRVVVDAAGYDIGIDSCDADLLSAEARVLISERRLFPWIASAASSKAMTLSRFSFAGAGAVDDVSFSTDQPAFTSEEKVFTLQWDAGVVGTMTCIVTRVDRCVTNAVDTSVTPRRFDLKIGSDGVAQVTVTNVIYQTELGYSAGLWRTNGCTRSGNAFICSGNENPIGFVASSRNVIGVGGTGCGTFAEAKEQARAKGGCQTILLMEDLVISSKSVSKGGDGGSFTVKAGDDLVLDLNGHTLTGNGADPTVFQNGGRLLITDTSEAKTGRVVPSARGRTRPAAVKVVASSETDIPTNVICAGWYDGAVVITGKVATVVGEVGYVPDAVVEGGAFTNLSASATSFYLEAFVTNPAVYFGCTASYWQTTASGNIWCGKGADSRWTNAENWKGGAVPTADDLAIFPPTDREAGWSVDFESGVAVTRFWMDGDIDMTGTNNCSAVRVVSGEGRFNGSGVIVFANALPGALTGAREAGEEEVRLGPDWTGTVRISNIKSAQPLTAIMGWGNSLSKVEFNGVRGYLKDRADYPIPYGLVLTDLMADGNVKSADAWKNETGYTGSTVSFPTLSGSGTFSSPKNLREILQVFQFKELRNFTGSFNLGGKRLLLGSTGSVASKSGAGHFTFANSVGVRGGLDWQGVNAHFGTNIVVYGTVRQSLMSYSGKDTPAVSSVLVTLIDPTTGVTNDTCRLVAENGKITIVSGNTIKSDGKTIEAEDLGTIKAGATFEIPDGSAVTIDGNRVIVNGVVVSSFADYYKVTGSGPYTVTFDEEQATPTLSDVSLVPDSNGNAVVQVSVSNAKKPLWYRLQTASSLGANWEGVGDWVEATGDTVLLNADAIGSSAFFRVIMTDQDPNGGEE